MSEHTTPPTVGSTVPTKSELVFLLPESKTNKSAMYGGAGVWTVIVVGVLLLLVSARPEVIQKVLTEMPDFPLDDIVFVEQKGPGGGGGGGGNKSPDPPKMVEAPKVKPVEPDPVPIPTPEPVKVPEPEPELVVEAPIITQSTQVAVLGPTTNTAPASMGTGSGGGAGTGSGRGTGSGQGDGIGPGRGGGIGGGVYQPGSGITNPTLIASAKPAYTSEGMLRRIQGEVWLDCVVSKTGAVDNCDVVKSLDSNNYGLDTEAMKAAKQFRFRPGMRQGEPVNVLVRIQIAFNMR
jgi:TonB family protein